VVEGPRRQNMVDGNFANAQIVLVSSPLRRCRGRSQEQTGMSISDSSGGEAKSATVHYCGKYYFWAVQVMAN